jgi:diguanylate cyclase
MIRDLFINFTIIVAALSLANMLFRDHIYQDNARNHLIIGLLAGLLGCLLMLFSVRISPDLFFDFRYLPVIIMALYYSPLAAIETSVIIGVFRIAYFGVSDASITAFVVVIFVGIISSLAGKLKVSKSIQWLISACGSCLIGSAGLFTLVITQPNRISIVATFAIGTMVGSMFMYFFTEYLSRNNRFYERLKSEVEHDYLTGLKNNRFFDQSFNRHIQEAIVENRKVSLLYIDIDHFKKINDQFGHANGDLVLQELGQILKQTARTRDVVTRRGGEEFTVLLVDCSLQHAMNAAERVRRIVEEHVFQLSASLAVRITVSIGVSSFPETAQEEQRLIEQADIALYQAKREGRNRVASPESFDEAKVTRLPSLESPE